MIYPFYVPRTNINDLIITLSEWFVKEGDLVEEESLVCCIETSKASVELSAGCAGFVRKLLYKEYDEVKIGKAICLMADSIDEEIGDYLDEEPDAEMSDGQGIASEEQPGVRATDRARNLAIKYEIDLNEIFKGRIIKEKDVRQYLQSMEERLRASDEAETPGDTELPEKIERDRFKEISGLISGARNWRTEKASNELLGKEQLRDLLSDIGVIYQTLRDEFRDTWDRCLPVNEMLFDRWEKARYLNFGEGSNVHESSFIFGEVQVGKMTFIGPFTYIDGSGGLNIGDHCSIATGSQIYSHDTITRALTGGKAKVERARTSIGNNCFIGPNAVVTKGVNIGDGCMVGAGSVVMSDIPPKSVAVGCPAKVVAKVIIRGDKIGFEKLRKTR
jgi:acetyltransferase-like isoleucine patch superfamily enzyme